MSDVLPEIKGLRGYKVVNATEFRKGNRITVHGEGPMHADVNLDAAKNTCEDIINESLDDPDSEMFRFFNKEDCELEVTFFDPPPCKFA